MNIHEYQANALLGKFGVAVPQGHVAYSPEEAVDAARKLAGSVWVVKAQIHAGGRGKAGGVKVVKSIDDVREAAQKMLGMTLVTHQTGPAGKLVKRIYVEGGCDIKRELYLGMLVDRATSRITSAESATNGTPPNAEQAMSKLASANGSDSAPACTSGTRGPPRAIAASPRSSQLRLRIPALQNSISRPAWPAVIDRRPVVAPGPGRLRRTERRRRQRPAAPATSR